MSSSWGSQERASREWSPMHAVLRRTSLRTGDAPVRRGGCCRLQRWQHVRSKEVNGQRWEGNGRERQWAQARPEDGDRTVCLKFWSPDLRAAIETTAAVEDLFTLSILPMRVDKTIKCGFTKMIKLSDTLLQKQFPKTRTLRRDF